MKTRIVFLPVPKSYKEQFNESGGAFPINPDIPIPAEITEEANAAPENTLANLSMEMIIRGMLRVIEEKQVDQKWIDYYSGFVLFLRPDILEICQEEQDRKNFTQRHGDTEG